MSKLYMYYEETSSGGGVCAGDENEDWPNYNDVYHTFTMKGVSLKKDISYYKEELNVDWDVKEGEKIFLLVVRYGSGGTFGRTYGHFTVQGVFRTEQEMLAHKAKLQKDTDNYRDRKRGESHNTPYYPWIGYFECLEGFEEYETEVGRNDSMCINDSSSKRFRI